jgi:hypothetical protein
MVHVGCVKRKRVLFLFIFVLVLGRRSVFHFLLKAVIKVKKNAIEARLVSAGIAFFQVGWRAAEK